MGDRFGVVIVVAADPDEFELIGKLAKLRQYAPCCLVKRNSVFSRIAIEDEPARRRERVDEFLKVLDLARFGAEMQIGKQDCVKHVNLLVVPAAI